MSEFQKDVDSYLSSKSSRLKGIQVSQGAFLFNPTTIQIKKADFELIKKSIRGFFSARNVLAEGKAGPKNYSVLMSYDFHMTENGPKLIEINTNAGQSLYVDALYKFKKEDASYLARPFDEAIKESFSSEATLMGCPSKPVAAITDENLAKQFFYPEMLMYADRFEQWGWHPNICDSRVLKWENDRLACGETSIDFVYNRVTDFYFENHPDLKSAYNSGTICFSPTPFEYDLLANKGRLVEFSTGGHLQTLVKNDEEREACEKVLPMTKLTKDFTLDELWKNKKHYFFKPKTSFAGKGVYRGDGIQRKVLEELYSKDYLVQEFLRAPEVSINNENYKYDIRFYAYKDEIQLVSARVYRGQVTNFRTEGNGICTVQLV